jgi:hypothetical protein
MSSFNGLEVSFKNAFNDLNMIREVIVNNQGIVAKQNMIQLDFLTKIDERLQKGFKMINIRITKGLENELAMLEIQIITQIGQRIDMMNIEIQKVKKELSNFLEIGLNRVYTEMANSQNIGLENMFENIRNLFLLNETKSGKEHEAIKLLFERGIGYLDKLINKGFMKADKSNDVKLSTIDIDIVVVYNELGNGMKSIRTEFRIVNA